MLASCHMASQITQDDDRLTAFLGILSMNETPPVRYLYGETLPTRKLAISSADIAEGSVRTT